jgi:abortive infection bacteriophage resistance protein
MLNILSKFRNVCSHNERLIYYRTRNDIPDMPLHTKLGIQKKGKQYIYGKRDFFAVVVALRYLLSGTDFKAFKRSLVRTINKYLKNTTAISETDLNVMLGFPPNWKSITHYNK